MTREEHKAIIGLVDAATKPNGSALPLDVEADAIIRALFVRKPEAAYRVMMLALAQAMELDRVKSELDARGKSFQGNWLARLLKKQDAINRVKRHDPRLSGFPQNNRGR